MKQSIDFVLSSLVFECVLVRQVSSDHGRLKVLRPSPGSHDDQNTYNLDELDDLLQNGHMGVELR